MTTNPIKANVQDYYNLAGYMTGAVQNHVPDASFGYTLGTAGVFGVGAQVWQGGSWAVKNRHDLKGGWANLQKQIAKDKKTIQSLKGGNVFKTTRNHYNFNQLKEIESKLQPIKKPKGYGKLSKSKKALYQKAKYKSDMYKDVRTMIKDAKKLRGKDLALKLKEIDKAIAGVRYDMHVQTVSGTQQLKAVTKRGKILAGAKKYTGYNKVSGGAKLLASKSNIVRNVGKLGKGGGAMAVIALACEAPELYDTYKTLGAAKGTKQLGKTAVVVGAEIAGYAAGAAAGAGVGAAAGAIAGTAICPVVGTAVGAIIGVACGLIGSWIAGKGARAIVGKSELDKAKEAEAQRLANEAKKDPNARKKLLSEAEARFEAADKSDEDAQKAFKSYEKIVNSEEKELKDNTETNDILKELKSLSATRQKDYGDTDNYTNQQSFMDSYTMMNPSLAMNNQFGNMNNPFSMNGYNNFMLGEQNQMFG